MTEKRNGLDGPSRKDGPSSRRGRPWPVGSMALVQTEFIQGITVRPLRPGDGATVQAVFDRLGPTSRRLRFGGAKNVRLPSDLELLSRVAANHHIARSSLSITVGAAAPQRAHPSLATSRETETSLG